MLCVLSVNDTLGSKLELLFRLVDWREARVIARDQVRAHFCVARSQRIATR